MMPQSELGFVRKRAMIEPVPMPTSKISVPMHKSLRMKRNEIGVRNYRIERQSTPLQAGLRDAFTDLMCATSWK